MNVVAAYAFPFLRVLRSEEAFRVAFDRAFLDFVHVQLDVHTESAGVGSDGFA